MSSTQLSNTSCDLQLKVGYLYSLSHSKDDKPEILEVTEIDGDFFQGTTLNYEKNNDGIESEWHLPLTDIGKRWHGHEIGPARDYPEYYL